LEVRRYGDGHPPVTKREREIRLNGISGVALQKTRIEISIRVFHLYQFCLSEPESRNYASGMSDNRSPFREYAIPQPLSPFVKSIWSFQGRDPILEKSRERILPDACVELVIHFRHPFRNYFADGTTNLQPESFVVGQMKRFMEIEPCEASGFVAVRFHARGAYLFFPQPLTEFTNFVVPLAEIWKNRADEYTERVALARGMSARVRIVEELLLEALRENGRRDCAVEHCVQLIQTIKEPIAVRELASTIGLSTRELARRFQSVVGMTPKEFLRVNRFIRAARRLRKRTDPSLTETAYECAYFDQAHFNHEFRAFAGMTPGQFMVTKNVAI
jgi:AraC-like DNA-binding protein